MHRPLRHLLHRYVRPRIQRKATGVLPVDARAAHCTVSQQSAYNSSPAPARFDSLFLTANYIFHNRFD
jgi:hypothetical protein